MEVLTTDSPMYRGIRSRHRTTIGLDLLLGSVEGIEVGGAIDQLSHAHPCLVCRPLSHKL